jgi:hypothetical protein
VQVGDVLDRGEDEIAILSLLAWLGKQARSKGGAVFQVLFSCFVLGKSPLILSRRVTYFRFTTLH